VTQAQDLLELHETTYPTYWAWSDAVERRARKDRMLQSFFGWAVHVGRGTKGRSLRNFPLQANGAEILRLACWTLTEGSVRVCAPVHDALLVEAAEDDIDDVAATCREAMERASERVLDGFRLRTEVWVVRHPDRLVDDRGRATW
jgi:DNA polymerase I-like protein with 3'-5' exonuclease and polymerase domains